MRGLGISENDSVRPSTPGPEPEPAAVIPSGPPSPSERRAQRDKAAQAVVTHEGGERELGNLVVFAPAPEVMYPLKGDLQDLGKKRGVEVDVKGWGDVMEGASRRKSTVI